MIRRISTAFFSVIVATVLLCSYSMAAKKPNILLVVADDMGYTDIGSFGDEIQT